MTLNRRWLLKEYGQTDDGDVIYGLFDNETKSPYFLYSLNSYYMNKINDILNNYEKEIHELKHSICPLKLRCELKKNKYENDYCNSNCLINELKGYE